MVELIYCLVFSLWGGVVRYLLDVKHGKTKRSFYNAISQMVISSFIGLLIGILSSGAGNLLHITIFTSGIAGAMGVVAVNYYWSRLTGGN
ncbi:phage holin family protein [Klebsiella michiganensis]|uniref:phage holin family protein n=1 Tax=Klebsiella michiganensis TaxID=1134687 RepID=UPI002890C0DE|nr:phage holin family protein [Klebsiella michiganensis]